MFLLGKTYSIGDKIEVPGLFGGFHQMIVTENGASNEELNCIFLDGEVLAFMSKNLFKEF